ncbi:MAG TPA: DUF417 family protein [Polyangiaceae bacterium]
MTINQELAPTFHVDDTRPLAWANRLNSIAGGVLRYGLVALLLLWGGMKFTSLEAEGIRPLVEHSPLLAWLYSLLGIRGGSSAIGVIEISAAILICMRHWKPAFSATGSLLAVGTFLITLSFLVTTPGILEPTNPFGGFIMKDIVLLGAALWSAAEALRAATHHEEP